MWFSKRKQQSDQIDQERKCAAEERAKKLKDHKRALENLKALADDYISKAVDDVAGEFK